MITDLTHRQVKDYLRTLPVSQTNMGTNMVKITADQTAVLGWKHTLVDKPRQVELAIWFDAHGGFVLARLKDKSNMEYLFLNVIDQGLLCVLCLKKGQEDDPLPDAL